MVAWWPAAQHASGTDPYLAAQQLHAGQADSSAEPSSGLGCKQADTPLDTSLQSGLRPSMLMPQLQPQQQPACKRAKTAPDSHKDSQAWLDSFQLDQPSRPAAEDRQVACWRPEALQPAWTGVVGQAAGWAGSVELPDLRLFVRDSAGERR